MSDSSAEPQHYADARQLADRATTPIVVGNVLFGTAGWTDPSLLRCHRFYPRGTSKPQARLEHYARHFCLVEVDATYYALLAPGVVTRWLEWTSDGFLFNIKAHASVTGHPVDLARLPAGLRDQVPPAMMAKGRVASRDLPGTLVEQMWSQFGQTLVVLASARRLGSVLLQFPPWFASTRGNARHLERLAARFCEYPVAVEFRNPTWLHEARQGRVFDLLRELRWSYVIVDEPYTPTGGVPAIVAVTNPELAVFRLHGHNTAGWRRGASVAERFDYLYRAAELAAWVGPVRRVAGEAERVHVVFNNCVQDYAVVNAKGLGALLAQAAAETTSGIAPE